LKYPYWTEMISLSVILVFTALEPILWILGLVFGGALVRMRIRPLSVRRVRAQLQPQGLFTKKLKKLLTNLARFSIRLVTEGKAWWKVDANSLLCNRICWPFRKGWFPPWRAKQSLKIIRVLRQLIFYAGKHRKLPPWREFCAESRQQERSFWDLGLNYFR